MNRKKSKTEKLGRITAVCFWALVVVVLFRYRNEITVEKIVGFSPDNVFLAIIVLLVLFAIKGGTACINGNILYMASGVMFSLPLAVFVNLLGSILMTTIPFWVGRKGGAGTIDQLTQRHKKLELLRSFPQTNQFRFTLILRLLGILPCEIISMYLGACRLQYKYYISGSLLGLFPAAAAYALIGEHLYASTSPLFKAAVLFLIATTVLAMITGAIWIRKKK